MDTNFSLSWDSYQKNICKGLSALQQNGEFVDMTLAADGHHVKVHQLVMSLVSPYIKDLISSAQCPHPVIFLNDVSQRTLISILEYIYTGEVLVTKGNLPDFMKAAKALHINGLMDVGDIDYASVVVEETPTKDIKTIRIKDHTNDNDDLPFETLYDDENLDDSSNNDDPPHMDDDASPSNYESKKTVKPKNNLSKLKKSPSLQFTSSNRGNLQMILNRFMYHLRYSGKNTAHRRWQCVDHETTYRCNACVITTGDTLVKRLGAHNHPFHDRKILRKTQTSKIYTNIKDIEIDKKT